MLQLVRLARAVALLVVAAGCSKEPPRKPPPIDHALYLTRFPFGGHTLEWWQERVRALSPGGATPDPALLALTIARAKKNGLDVSDDGVVKVNPALTARILQRLDAGEAK